MQTITKLNQDAEPSATAPVRVQPVVVPQRRRHSPLMVMMACAGAMSVGMAVAASKGGVVMVDDVTKRRDDNEPQLTAADMDAILAAKIKRERKALLKKMRHNAGTQATPTPDAK